MLVVGSFRKSLEFEAAPNPKERAGAVNATLIDVYRTDSSRGSCREASSLEESLGVGVERDIPILDAMKSMFSAVFSPLGLFTGPAGNKRERKDSVRSPTESVGSSSSASGTIPASPLSPASSTSLPSPLSAFSADFAAIDDVVIDRAGNLFWKDPMSGVRTPVKEEEDAEVRKRLRVRLLGEWATTQTSNTKVQFLLMLLYARFYKPACWKSRKRNSRTTNAELLVLNCYRQPRLCPRRQAAPHRLLRRRKFKYTRMYCAGNPSTDSLNSLNPGHRRLRDLASASCATRPKFCIDWQRTKGL